MLALLALVPSATFAAGRAESKNVVVRFLMCAELQSETGPQRAEIYKALHDATALPVAELKTTRYADYEGKAGQWTLPTLLSRYFVPPSPMSLNDADFFRDVGTKEAREILKKWCRRLETAE